MNAYLAQKMGVTEVPPEPETGSGPVAKREYKGISYELLRCAKETRLITCHVILVNNGVDRTFRIGVNYSRGYMTYLFDQRGHKFLSSRIRIADEEGEGSSVSKFLITEVPTPMTLFFQGVPSSIELIKILHLAIDDGSLEFRDLHFSDGVSL